MCSIQNESFQIEKSSDVVGRDFIDKSQNAADDLIQKIRKNCYESPISKELGSFLMSHNLIGAIWSAKHLIWLLSLVRENLDTNLQCNKEKCLVLLGKEVLSHYKSLAFDELPHTKSELENSLDRKLKQLFRYFEPITLATIIPKETKDTEVFFHNKWTYMKSTLGYEIRM
jgi:hypothetical protein